jgi:hypothetical protein
MLEDLWEKARNPLTYVVLALGWWSLVSRVDVHDVEITARLAAESAATSVAEQRLTEYTEKVFKDGAARAVLLETVAGVRASCTVAEGVLQNSATTACVQKHCTFIGSRHKNRDDCVKCCYLGKNIVFMDAGLKCYRYD